MRKVGFISFIISDDVRKFIPEAPLEQTKQLVAAAFFDDSDTCTHYLVHEEFLTALFERAHGHLMIPETVKNGLLGTHVELYLFLKRSINNPIFEFSQLNDINEENTAKILKESQHFLA